MPATGQLLAPGGQRAQVDLLALHEPAVADGDPAALDRGDRPVPGDVLEAVGGHRIGPSLLGATDDGLGQRMFRLPLDGRH